jgi:hypothetical protein
MMHKDPCDWMTMGGTLVLSCFGFGIGCPLTESETIPTVYGESSAISPVCQRRKLLTCPCQENEASSPDCPICSAYLGSL